ncbi:MAG: hypothetical protein JWN08_26 [Frankiales bacterium]|nr:hypothetical protein [Frankiales bacterium]
MANSSGSRPANTSTSWVLGDQGLRPVRQHRPGAALVLGDGVTLRDRIHSGEAKRTYNNWHLVAYRNPEATIETTAETDRRGVSGQPTLRDADPQGGDRTMPLTAAEHAELLHLCSAARAISTALFEALLDSPDKDFADAQWQLLMRRLLASKSLNDKLLVSALAPIVLGADGQDSGAEPLPIRP